MSEFRQPALSTIMKSPGLILCLPIDAIEFKLLKSCKLQSDFYIPKSKRADIGDVFDGRSLCLLDYIAQADDGS